MVKINKVKLVNEKYICFLYYRSLKISTLIQRWITATINSGFSILSTIARNEDTVTSSPTSVGSVPGIFMLKQR